MGKYFTAKSVPGSVVFFKLSWVPDMEAGGMRQQYTVLMRVNRVELDPGGSMFQIKDDLYTEEKDVVNQVLPRLLAELGDCAGNEIAMSFQETGEELRLRKAQIVKGSKKVPGLMVGSEVYEGMAAAGKALTDQIFEFWSKQDEAKDESEELSESTV